VRPATGRVLLAVTAPAASTRPAEARAGKERTLALWGERAPWREVRAALVRLSIVVLVITAVVIGLGELLTNASAAATVRGWDLSFERTLAAHRTGWADHLTAGGTWFAESVPILDLTIFAVDLVARATRRWRAAAFVAAAVAGEKLVYAVSVLVVDRPRPPVATVGQTYATSSFPSGHVGSAVVLYGAVALLVWWGRPDRRATRIAVLAGAIVLSLVVAFCRMYRGFHFPTDVVTGAAMGLVWLTACAVVLAPRRVVAPAR
jgi:membrane-associated phospholipid phosphatase